MDVRVPVVFLGAMLTMLVLAAGRLVVMATACVMATEIEAALEDEADEKTGAHQPESGYRKWPSSKSQPAKRHHQQQELRLKEILGRANQSKQTLPLKQIIRRANNKKANLSSKGCRDVLFLVWVPPV